MEKQKKRKLNAVDTLVLVVVLVAVVAIAVRMIGGGSADGPGVKNGPQEYYVITFTSDAVSHYLLERLPEGGEVTDEDMTLSLGDMVDRQLAPSVFYAVNSSGELVNNPRPDYQSLKLMCRVMASDNGFGVTVDELNLGVGHTMIVRAGDVKINMTVYDIQKIGDTAYPTPAPDGQG